MTMGRTRRKPPDLTKDQLREIAIKRHLFESLGFSETVALEMIHAGVSVSQARDLIIKGCPPNLVPKILI